MEYYSASRIKTLNDCKKLFFHKYVAKDLPEEEDGPYAILGSALHTALELYRKNPTNKQDLLRYFTEDFSLGKDHFLYKEGTRILYSFDIKSIFRGDLIDVEMEFEEVINGYPVHGIIDKVERLPSGVILCTDYKSNKSIEANEYVHQLAIYDVVLSKMFPGEPREHELLYLRHNRAVPFKFTDETEQKVMDIFASAERMINENKSPSLWPPLKKQGKPCGWCPMKKECFS